MPFKNTSATKWYHGSLHKFDQFKTLSKAGVSKEVAEQPIFLTSDIAFARDYAKLRGYVYEVRPHVTKTFDGHNLVNWDERYYYDWKTFPPLGKEVFEALLDNKIWPDGEEHAESYFEALAERQWDATQSPEFVRWMNTNGYDSFIEVGEGAENMGVFDPAKLEILSCTPVQQLAKSAAPKGVVYYHGGPDIRNNVLRTGQSGAIFFTKSREYACQYLKSTGKPGVLYEIDLDLKSKRIFDPENRNDLRQLKYGFLKLMEEGEYDDEDDALSDYETISQLDLIDWATGGQYMEVVEKAGFHGMRFRERPGTIFVLFSRLHSENKLYYSWAVRPSPKQKKTRPRGV